MYNRKNWTEEEKRTCDTYYHGGVVTCLGCPYANFGNPDGMCEIHKKHRKEDQG